MTTDSRKIVAEVRRRRERRLGGAASSPALHRFLGGHRFLSESDFRDYIANLLRDKGWVVETEYRILGCRIDVLARKDNDVFIIEAKLHVSYPTGALSVIEQLHRYAKVFPQAKLWVASPVTIKSREIEKLKAAGIDVLTMNDVCA